MSLRTHAPLERSLRSLRPRQRVPPRPLSPYSSILALQRGVGNAAVTQLLQRQPAVVPKIDYQRATERNKKYAKKLKWEGKLAGLKPDWDKAWKDSNYGTFAELVAAFQLEHGLEPQDGELGPATWNRLRPIGDVIADRSVNWAKSESVCSIATQERLTEGYRQATGQPLVDEASSDEFRVILHSITSRMKDVDEQYRATGAAGALVFLGKGTFVTHDEIWDEKKLLPGAAMQVWRKKSDVERVKQGKKPRSTGTSFVFIKYVGENSMQVKHFGDYETIRKSTYQFWVGANLNDR
jgi:hypothetical protein